MRRPIIVFGLALLACVLVFVPTAGAALDPSDAVCSGTGMLASESGGDSNTACGYNALNANTTGSANTAAGWNALNTNTTGSDNTAAGQAALRFNTGGNYNTAAGSLALFANDTGTGNTADGFQAMEFNGAGTYNTAAGYRALFFNSTGDFNTAAGLIALANNTTGSNNTALGYGAGETGNLANVNTTGSNNTFLGYNSGPGTSTQLSNATAIGADALVSASNALVLGAAGVKVGVGTTTPQSLLQVSTPSSSYGSYLQLPTVSSGSPPPASDCNTSTLVGRLVLQYDASKPQARTTLWSCSPAGVWTSLAKG